MKRILTVTLVAALALFAGSAYANFCARDVVPATTLLVPYVAVSMSGTSVDPTGVTTYLSVTNASHEATIIHVVVWNAISDHVLDFDQVLSGYDVWSVNFADVLSGRWSAFQTSNAASAPPNTEPGILRRTPFEWGPDGRSAYGAQLAQFSNWSRGLPTPQSTNILPPAGCMMASLGDQTGGQYAPILVDLLQAPLFARDHGGCYGTGTQSQPTATTGDWLAGVTANPTFFYVTVDNFRVCDLIFPEDIGYFAGDENFENVLIGEVYYVNTTSGYSEATPAVHIESDLDSLLPLANSFYGERAGDPATFLEPLATAFGFRYFNDAPAVTSSVILWKNRVEFYETGTRVDDVIDCGSYLYYAWDQDEHVITRAQECPFSPCEGASIDPNEFPFETQEVPINTANFSLPDKYGWMLLVLPPSYGTPYSDPTPEAYGLLTFEYMGWVGTKILYTNFSAGLEAATMANAHCFPTQVQTPLGVNYDYDDISGLW